MEKAYNREAEILLHNPIAFQMEVIGLLRQQSQLLGKLVELLEKHGKKEKKENPDREE